MRCSELVPHPKMESTQRCDFGTAISGFDETSDGTGRPQGGSNRNRNLESIRRADAFRFVSFLSLADHKEASPSKHHLRVVVVPQGRHETFPISRKIVYRFGTNGLISGRTRACIRQAMAIVGMPRWPRRRSDSPGAAADHENARLQASYCERVERRRYSGYGTASLPFAFPVLRGKRQA